MRILLLGKAGQLGWELNHTLAPLGELFAYDRSQLDLTNLRRLTEMVDQLKPHMIVNAAGYTFVDLAEDHEEQANLLNVQMPQVLAQAACRHESVLIHYSTDYVFDGTKGSAYNERDATNPLNLYGQGKLLGEQLIEQTECRHVILRTSWMYSLRGNNFVTKTLLWSRKNEVLRVVKDQIGSPTYARGLAEITAAMIARGLYDPLDYFSVKSGVYHVGGAGSVSRFDFASAILRLDPHPEQQATIRIEPALTEEFPTPAKRPLVTPLDCSRFEQTFGLHLQPWEKSLQLAMSR